CVVGAWYILPRSVRRAARRSTRRAVMLWRWYSLEWQTVCGSLIRHSPRLWCGLLCLLTSLSAANAADSKQDVQSLYNFCKDQKAPQYGLCLGYISGIADILYFLRAYNQEHPQKEAIPFQLCETPSYGAMAQAFVNWAEKNPQY